MRSFSGSGGPSGSSMRLFHVLPLTGVTADRAALATPGTPRGRFQGAPEQLRPRGRLELRALRVEAGHEHRAAIEAGIQAGER